MVIYEYKKMKEVEMINYHSYRLRLQYIIQPTRTTITNTPPMEPPIVTPVQQNDNTVHGAD